MGWGKLWFCVIFCIICDTETETVPCCQGKKNKKKPPKKAEQTSSIIICLSVCESVHAYALGVWLILIVALLLFLPVCQVWSLAMVATDLCLGPKSDPDLEIPWAQHPFGRQLLESLYVSECWGGAGEWLLK